MNGEKFEREDYSDSICHSQRHGGSGATFMVMRLSPVMGFPVRNRRLQQVVQNDSGYVQIRQYGKKLSHRT